MDFSATLAHSGPTILPLVLIQAQHLCFQKTAVMDLKRTARSTLFGILAFVKVHAPMSVIWPKRATLRKQANILSDSSLYRGLAELSKKGYIKREAQLHNTKNGRFHISRLHLTEKAVNLLNLTKEKASKKVIHNQPSSILEDGYIKNIVKNKTPSKEESPEVIHNPKQQLQKLDLKTRLPKPLVKLTKLGLTPKTICWLMRLAREKNKRLEDVMNFAWKYLERLVNKGTQTIKAYLISLFSKNQDFAFQVKQAQNEEEINRDKSEKHQKISEIIQYKQGYSIFDKNNDLIGVIEGESIRLFASEKTGFVQRYMPIFQASQYMLSSIV